MKIKDNCIFPLIKVKTPTGIDFFNAHKEIIDSTGYVWFYRFGKNNMKYDTIASCAPFLFIKNSGISNGGLYIARYESIENKLSEKENAYPKYYHNIPQCGLRFPKLSHWNTICSSKVLLAPQAAVILTKYSSPCAPHFLLDQPKTLLFKEDNYYGIYRRTTALLQAIN